MSQIRILLADDHKILIDAVKKLVEREFEVVGLFENGRDLLESAPGLRPDVIVLDIGMPKMNGLLVAEQLKKVLPETKLIFLTMNRDPTFVSEAFRLGVSGYILKNASGRELVQAIHEVAAGGHYTSEGLSDDIEEVVAEVDPHSKSRHDLTLRQKEVLQLLAEGRLMKEIAVTLKISEPTVAYHKYSMMQRLNIKSNADLLRIARSVLPSVR